MMQETTLRLYRHWAALKGRSAAPRRSALQPRALGTALPDLFTISGAAFRFGFVGSRLEASLRRPLPGTSFSALWREEDREILGNCLSAARDLREAVLVEARLPVFTGVAQPRLDAVEILLLPIRHDDGALALLGAMEGIPSYRLPYDVGELGFVGSRHPEEALELLGNGRAPVLQKHLVSIEGGRSGIV